MTTREEIAETVAGMCMAGHPFYRRIGCMRNKKHAGMHWFQLRWVEGECALCREQADDLDDKGICSSCIERLYEEAVI